MVGAGVRVKRTFWIVPGGFAQKRQNGSRIN
jgi:hypothetical protein